MPHSHGVKFMNAETGQTPEQLEALRKRLETEHTNEGPVLDPSARCIPVVLPLVAISMNAVAEPKVLAVTYRNVDAASGIVVSYPDPDVRPALLGGTTAKLVIATPNVQPEEFPNFGISGAVYASADVVLTSAQYLDRSGQFGLTLTQHQTLPQGDHPQLLQNSHEPLTVYIPHRMALDMLAGPVKLDTPLRMWLLD